MLPLLFGALALFLLYFTIRKAVTHGILDVEEIRAERERAARFDETLRNGTLPDAPQS